MAMIKCRMYFPAGGSITFSLDGNTKICKNFKLSEFANNLAADDIKMEFYPEFWEFAEMIQELRDWYNKSMTVNSCYRTKSFNKKCGGDANSLHLKGLALDWGIRGMDASGREQIKTMWKAICSKHGRIGGINYYTNGFHLSFDEGKYFGAKEFVVRSYIGRKGDW